MKTRSSHRWKSLPGNFDTLNTFQLFSGKKFGIPTIEKQDIEVCECFYSYNTFKNQKGGIHFFIDDYRFETVWTRAERSLSKLRKAKVVFSPDFSLLRGMPEALQIYNTYRNRWCGRYWQKMGIRVIPTVCWSDKDSFEFCFEGVERGSVVGISTNGVLVKDWGYFVEGLEEMLKRLDPEKVICYGMKYKDRLKKYKKIELKKGYWR